MPALYHYSRNNQRLGPVPLPELRQLAAKGQLAPNDLIWTEGMANWVCASTLQGLFAPPTPPKKRTDLPPAAVPVVPTAAAAKGSSVGLLIGAIAGGVVVLGAIVLIIVLNSGSGADDKQNDDKKNDDKVVLKDDKPDTDRKTRGRDGPPNRDRPTPNRDRPPIKPPEDDPSKRPVGPIAERKPLPVQPDRPDRVVAVLGTECGRHWGSILSVAYSPDGKQIASAGRDGFIRLWDAEDLQPTLLLAGHDRTFAAGSDGSPGHTVHAIAFSKEGNRLASVGQDQTVRIWELAGDEVGKERKLSWHESVVRSVAFAPDGKSLASGDDAGNIVFWDISLDSPRKRGATLKLSYKVSWLRYSLDGKTLISYDASGLIRLWQLDADPPREAAQLNNYGYPVGFSADGETLMTSYGVGDLYVVDAATLKARPGAPNWPTNTNYPMAVSPDLTRVALLVSGGGMKLATLGSDKSVDIQELVRQGRPLHAAAFSPDGKTLAVGGDDNILRLWRVGDKERDTGRRGHDAPLLAVTFARDGKLAVTSSVDGTVRLWDPEGAAAEEKSRITQHSEPVNALATSPDGKILATGGQDKLVLLWDLTDDGPQERPTLAGANSPITGLAFSGDGKVLAVAGENRTVWLWDMTNRKPSERARVGEAGQRVVFDVNTKRFAGNAGKAFDRFGNLSADPNALGSGFTALAIRHDGKRIALAGADGRVVVSDDEGNKIREWQFPGPVNGVAFSPDGEHLLTANANGTAYVLRP